MCKRNLGFFFTWFSVCFCCICCLCVLKLYFLCLGFSLQSTSAQTCATIVSACCFKTHLFSGGRKRGIKVGSRWCWIPCRAWGSWTGGIRSTPLLTTPRRPDLAPPTDHCHKVNHVDISLHLPNTFFGIVHVEHRFTLWCFFVGWL